MTARVQPLLQPIVQRWDGFVVKVQQRIDEATQEADQGLDQLIAQYATDHGPMGAAFSALQARFHGLGQKIDEAYEKVDQEVDQIADRDDLESADHELIGSTRDTLIAKRRALRDDLELRHATLEMKKNADWARRLRQIAQQELERPVACSHCGAPLAVADPSKASQVRCGACQAVNDVMPGTAAALFYQGLGAHALASETAWPQWLAQREADARCKAFRHATAYDFWLTLEAAKAYWTAYYQAGLAIYPGFAADVPLEQAVAAKMKHYTAYKQPIDQQKEEILGSVVEASAKGDAATMQRIVGALPHFVSLDDCLECLVERQHFPAAQFLFGIKFDKDGEDGNKQKWIATELADMRKFLRK